MPSPIYNVALARAARRLPLVKRIPLAWMVIAAELAMLAKTHYERLSQPERRRLVILMREAKGQPRNMSASDHDEFERLVSKLEPKLFAQAAAEKFSPVPSRNKLSK
jgi:hypothetical protein